MTTNYNQGGDTENLKPISFNSIMAPTTTYTGKNPSFAVYEIDEETMLPLNATTYFFDIVKANAGNPKWEVYHNILEAYQIEDMSPSSFHAYAKRVLNSEEEAVKLIDWNAKSGPEGKSDGCDGRCRRNMYCDMVTSHTDDEDACGQMPGVYRKTPAYGFNKKQ